MSTPELDDQIMAFYLQHMVALNIAWDDDKGERQKQDFSRLGERRPPPGARGHAGPAYAARAVPCVLSAAREQRQKGARR